MHKSATLKAPAAAPETSASLPANRLVLEAIALRNCLRATYNRMSVLLAPHVLYTRHGEVYVDAVTLERDGQRPRETKIGAFKLSGLRDLTAVPEPFMPNHVFNPREPRYAGTTLFAVDG